MSASFHIVYDQVYDHATGKLGKQYILIDNDGESIVLPPSRITREVKDLAIKAGSRQEPTMLNRKGLICLSIINENDQFLISSTDELPEEQKCELEEVLRDDILLRYDNSEYHDPDVVDAYLQDHAFALDDVRLFSLFN
jgi:hypothetical protein